MGKVQDAIDKREAAKKPKKAAKPKEDTAKA